MNALLCFILGSLFSVKPESSSQATSSTEESSLVAEQADELAHAKNLYRQGKAKFETMDYLGAIELWTNAYGEIPATSEYSDIQARFLYNIARARMRAYAMDGDMLHLKQAKGLLERYLQTLGEDSHGETQASTEVQQVKDILGQVTSDLHAAEQAAVGKAKDEKNEQHLPPVQAVENIDRDHEKKQGRKLLISGGVLFGSSVGLFAAMTVGLLQGKKAERDGQSIDQSIPASELADIHQRGQTANTLALATGIGGGILGVSGIVVMAVGGKKLSKSKQRVDVAFSPMGIQIKGQF